MPDAADFARLDHRRADRTSEPEVIYGEHKAPAEVAALLAALLAGGSSPVLATRCSPAHAAAAPAASYDSAARLLVARRAEPVDLGTVVIACAGTSDLPVAREAAGTLDAFGVRTDIIADVGVAGVHRILAETDRLAAARVCIVVAGMEAALPTVVAGLVSCPVIGVPTSVGYGATFEGLAALLGMLTACAPGISVVNIDNGFGAAMVARRILRVGG
ncbi:MAG: nickel pincer cofactor biosynthesis protein LarB [Actinomycetota bacterium]|nr:nickel pincer cofactor biosynthesis protein LarB [Actinomycetota bacterium]